MSSDQPRLTATVEVVRAPDDTRGIAEDIMLRGEAHIRVDRPPDRSLVYVDQVSDVRFSTEGNGYTLSAIAALRGGFHPPTYPRMGLGLLGLST
jgi:hypothetical protein